MQAVHEAIANDFSVSYAAYIFSFDVDYFERFFYPSCKFYCPITPFEMENNPFLRIPLFKTLIIKILLISLGKDNNYL